MKTISEICRLTGLTKRTIRWYEEKGLIKHTDRTASGYFLYEDETIVILFTIRVLTDLDYTLNQIKEILELGSSLDLNSELEKVLIELNERQKKIEDRKSYVEFLIMINKLPKPIKDAVNAMGLYNILNDSNMVPKLNDLDSVYSEFNDCDFESKEEKDTFYSFYLGFIGFGLYSDESLSLEEKDESIQFIFKIFFDWNLFSNDLDLRSESRKYVSALNLILLFKDVMFQAITDLNLEEVCSADYVFCELESYAKQVCEKENEDYKQLLSECKVFDD